MYPIWEKARREAKQRKDLNLVKATWVPGFGLNALQAATMIKPSKSGSGQYLDGRPSGNPLYFTILCHLEFHHGRQDIYLRHDLRHGLKAPEAAAMLKLSRSGSGLYNQMPPPPSQNGRLLFHNGSCFWVIKKNIPVRSRTTDTESNHQVPPPHIPHLLSKYSTSKCSLNPLLPKPSKPTPRNPTPQIQNFFPFGFCL